MSEGDYWYSKQKVELKFLGPQEKQSSVFYVGIKVRDENASFTLSHTLLKTLKPTIIIVMYKDICNTRP